MSGLQPKRVLNRGEKSMVRREDVREGSRVVVKATGSGENKPGMVYKCYPTFAVVDYRINWSYVKI